MHMCMSSVPENTSPAGGKVAGQKGSDLALMHPSFCLQCALQCSIGISGGSQFHTDSCSLLLACNSRGLQLFHLHIQLLYLEIQMKLANKYQPWTCKALRRGGSEGVWPESKGLVCAQGGYRDDHKGEEVTKSI